MAYAVFEVPSNWIMKRYVRPSLWLGFLLFGWGILTVGFTWIQTYGQIVGVRFLIGVFEVRQHQQLSNPCRLFEPQRSPLPPPKNTTTHWPSN